MSTRASESGICPHCGTGVRFEPAKIGYAVNGEIGPFPSVQVRVPGNASLQLFASGCPVCGMPVLEVGQIRRPTGDQIGGPGVIYPKGRTRPLAPEVIANAPSLAADFAEAVAVLPSSRKASAALSRRCLQFILVNAGKATKRDLADQIDEILPTLPVQLAENVDAIRQVGNFAAHPMKSTNSGSIVEVEDGEAEWLLEVIEELCEFYYVAPIKAAARRAALNQKLADLKKPPLKSLPT